MGRSKFSDHFSHDSAEYRRARPEYPNTLFEQLVALAPGRDLAWDCATGNGQAAVALTAFFDRVVATDASPEQLSQATPHERITYREAMAHDSGIEAGTVDLVTVAAALHWFAEEPFFEEVRRVAKPGAVLAAWSYGARVQVTPKVDEAVIRFAADVLGPYWPPGFYHNLQQYRSLPFPFEALDAPSVDAVVEWSLDDLVANIKTWSGYRLYVEAEGRAPAEELDAALRPAWGDPNERRTVRWPLHFKVGRIR